MAFRTRGHRVRRLEFAQLVEVVSPRGPHCIAAGHVRRVRVVVLFLLVQGVLLGLGLEFLLARGLHRRLALVMRASFRIHF